MCNYFLTFFFFLLLFNRNSSPPVPAFVEETRSTCICRKDCYPGCCWRCWTSYRLWSSWWAALLPASLADSLRPACGQCKQDEQHPWPAAAASFCRRWLDWANDHQPQAPASWLMCRKPQKAPSRYLNALIYFQISEGGKAVVTHFLGNNKNSLIHKKVLKTSWSQSLYVNHPLLCNLL